MKKRVMAIIFFIMTISLYSFGESIKIDLLSSFHLNPILGINGDPYEANSKFIQRFIFSPLVFPIEDPYLQDNFNIAMDLSIIDKLEYLEYNKYGYGVWKTYDLLNLPDGQGSTSFRVHLRQGLYFRADNEWNKANTMSITAADVVYSYRLAHITSDRIYNKHLKSYTYSSLGLNTLLYSKLNSFYNIYIDLDNQENIYFEMGNIKYTCFQFLKLLAYVPVLSCRQLASDNPLRSPGDEKYISLHGKLNLKDIQNLNNHNNYLHPRYDWYDFEKIQYTDKGKLTSTGERFYNNPWGYGQYYVENKSARKDTSRENDLYYEIYLKKNEDWCEFDNAVKRVGSDTYYQKNYQDKKEIIHVSQTEKDEIPTKIKNIKSTDILYNVYLSANMFDAKSPEDKLLSEKADKKKMQISHYLYGIYFGPDPKNIDRPVDVYTRDFFASFADRSRIENMVKYLSVNMDDIVFDARVSDTRNSLFKDLQVQRLYYPFYLGINGSDKNGNSIIGNYYADCEEKDIFYQDYRRELHGATLEQHYMSLNTSNNETFRFYNDFVGGTTLPPQIKKNIDDKYQFIRNKIVQGGRLNLAIFYNDNVGKAIADHYKALLDDYFKNQRVTANINPVYLSDYKDWQEKARNNARQGMYTLLVKGWNYKFDLLDELDGQFVEESDKRQLKDYYIQLINGSNQSTEETIFKIAQQFEQNIIMVPLVGIQNYAVYLKDSTDVNGIAASMKASQGESILLLPYYWRKKN